MQGDWKSLAKIRKLFPVLSRNQAIAVLNRAKKLNISYEMAYLEIKNEQGF